MKRTASPRTAQTEGPFRLQRLILTCLARKQEDFPAPAESKCVQIRPRTLTQVRCCSTPTALRWVQEIAEDALAGDGDASRVLSLVVEHYLRVVRQARPR